MHRFSIWIMILMNHEKTMLVDGACGDSVMSDGKTAEMICHTMCDEIELPIPSKDFVYVGLDITGCQHMANLSKEALVRDYGDIVTFRASEIPDMAEQLKNNFPPDSFSELTKLEEFYFTNSNLTDAAAWVLSPNLRRYFVDENNYTTIDLQQYTRLDVVSANDNNLSRLPMFSHPPPQITELLLKRNPIKMLTVEDLAPLCWLTKLEVGISRDVFNVMYDGFCHCQRLVNWTRMFNISGSIFDCFSPLIEDKINCVSNFSGWLAIRTECEGGDTSKKASMDSLRTILKIIFGIIIAILITTVCGLLVFNFFYPRAKEDTEKRNPSLDIQHYDEHEPEHEEEMNPNS